MTTTEAEFDDEQYAMLAALTDYESTLCPGCGHPLAESMAADADEDAPWNDHVYVGEYLGRCHACTAISKVRDKHMHGDDGQPMKHADALRFTGSRVHRQARRPRAKTPTDPATTEGA